MQCLFSESHGLHLGELMRDSLPFTARFQLGKNMWFHYIQIDPNRSSCIRWTTFPGSENEVMSERVFSSDGINSIHMHVSFRYLGLYIL